MPDYPLVAYAVLAAIFCVALLAVLLLDRRAERIERDEEENARRF